MRKEIQNSFSGGINLFADDFRIGETEYGAAYNVRNRKGSLAPIYGPVADSLSLTVTYGGTTYQTQLSGKMQGCYGFGKYLLLFVSGSGYYKHYLSTSWNRINNLRMDANVDFIYVQGVPYSVPSYPRYLRVAGIINGTESDTRMDIKTDTLIPGYSSGAVVQDGITQPHFLWIDSDGYLQCKKTHSYAEWTMSDREYVPIGLNMAVVDGILFVVSPDRKSIFRSVSGRPLDFVVNVDINGNKGGDATTTSYAISSLEITALVGLKSKQLLAGTIDGCHPISLNYTKTIFGEPTFTNPNTFKAGIVNQFSVVELINDYVFIDFDGLRSYNAISALDNEGRNSIFSLKVHSAIDKIPQLKTAAFVFDNYAFFNVKSYNGYIVMVYDMLSECFVSFDKYDIGAIKMFAVVNEADNPVLYAMTETGLYALFQSTAVLSRSFIIRSVVGKDDNKPQLSMHMFRLTLDEIMSPIAVTVGDIVDNRLNKTLRHPITITDSPPSYPLNYPIYFNSADNTRSEAFRFVEVAKVGAKIGASVKLEGKANIIHCQFELDERTWSVPLKQQASIS